MPALTIVGVDLSGPTNVNDTAVVWFAGDATGMTCVDFLAGASDAALASVVGGLVAGGSTVAVGLDAPLSYNAGGGDRPGDRALRSLAQQHGLPSGSVMTPTTTRMAYLTLRGHAVARHLMAIGVPAASIAEVHPSAALVLHGAAARDVIALKTRLRSRLRLLRWMRGQGLRGIPSYLALTSHLTAACAAALAAWRWALGKPAWCMLAAPPAHPFDFAC